MKPVDFKGSNHSFGKPVDWNEKEKGECGSLPVNNNGEVSWSCWELDEHDLKQIMETKRVWLGIWAGKQHPVCSVHAYEPVQVTQFNYKNQDTEDMKEG
ncbi:MAG: hypothetical protein ACFE9R_13610 [Candidatus Hermodarchaeota archaeon]